MKTASFVGNGLVKVVDKPIPVVGRNEVLIKVAFCGLCGSEKRIVKSGFDTFTPGHEISGTVEECGDSPAPFEKGTKVLVYLADFCQECGACLQGNTSQCSAKKRLIGWHFDGGYAQYVVVPKHMVYPIGSLPLELGVLALDTIGTAFHGLRLGDIDEDCSVLVIGCGPIGLGCLCILKNHYKIKRLHAADTSIQHLEYAKALGIESAILVNPKDTAGSLVDELKGQVDRVIEVVGLDETVSAAMKFVKPNGKIVMIGEPEKALTIQRSADWVLKDFSLINSWYFPISEMPENLRFVVNNINEVRKILTHVYPIESMTEAYELFGNGQTGKVLVSLTPKG